MSENQEETGFVSPVAHYESMTPEEKNILQKQADLYNILNRLAMSADGHGSAFQPVAPLNMLEARADASEMVHQLLMNPAFATAEAIRVCMHMVDYELKIAPTSSVELLRSHLQVAMLLINAINDERLKNPPAAPNPIITVPSMEAAGLEDDSGHS